MKRQSVIPLSTDDAPPVVVEMVYQMKIKDVMTTEVVTAKQHDTLRSVQQLMRARSITGVPIVEGRRLIGIVSVDDILNALDKGYIEDEIEAHMSRNVMVLEEDMPLSFAIQYYEKYSYGRFPVLDRNRELSGIITSRDIIVALLIKLDEEFEKLEQQIGKQPLEFQGTLRQQFATRRYDFEHAGRSSTQIKKILKERKIDSKTVRRAAVAAYELEMNQVLHSNGGTISLQLSRGAITILADDVGPGIANVDNALEEGFSTATDWIRSLGFGAGMGLPNARRVSDEFTIHSSPQGTHVMVIIYLKDDQLKDDQLKEEQGEDTGTGNAT